MLLHRMLVKLVTVDLLNVPQLLVLVLLVLFGHQLGVEANSSLLHERGRPIADGVQCSIVGHVTALDGVLELEVDRGL